MSVHPWLSTENFFLGGCRPFQGILFWGNDFWPFPILECDAFSSGCSQNAHDELKGRAHVGPQAAPCVSPADPSLLVSAHWAVCTFTGSEKSCGVAGRWRGWRVEGGSEGAVERRESKMVAGGRGHRAARGLRCPALRLIGFWWVWCLCPLSGAFQQGSGPVLGACSLRTVCQYQTFVGAGRGGGALLLTHRVEAVLFKVGWLWFKDICVRELTFPVV